MSDREVINKIKIGEREEPPHRTFYLADVRCESNLCPSVLNREACQFLISFNTSATLTPTIFLTCDYSNEINYATIDSDVLLLLSLT